MQIDATRVHFIASAAPGEALPIRAFSPLEQLPPAIQMISQTFPLTHFCHAFRLVNMQDAGIGFIVWDLVFMFLGAVACCGGAAVLLQRIQE